MPAMLSEPPCPDRIDVQRPDAPELAAFGPHDVGVRTIDLVAHDRPDLRGPTLEAPVGRTDRHQRVEVWYPATLPAGVTAGGTYRATTPDGITHATLHGRAVRDAPPATGNAPFPLVIVSHGYPGNRFLLSHLTENLASKGFVVASIDHPESTYEDRGPFASTLYHRPLDQRFVLDQVERLAADDDAFLAGRVDASRTAIVGYSMGGYGALVSIGAGVTEAAVDLPFAPPERLLAQHQAGSDALEARRDPRVAAVIAIAPWGMNAGLWDASGLAGIRTPVLFLAGSADDVSGYEHGVRAIFEGAVNADRAPRRRPRRRGAHPRAARGLADRHLRPLRRPGLGHGPHERRRAARRDRVPAAPPSRRSRDGPLPRPRTGRGRRRLVGRRRRQAARGPQLLGGLRASDGRGPPVRAPGPGPVGCAA